MRTLSFPLSAMLAALSACNGTPEQPLRDANVTAPGNIATSVGGDVATVPARAPAATPIPTGPVACSAQIGAAEAQALADQCRAVSPATRPPCNAANSCAMIRDEIVRSCELFRDDPPAECGNGSARERAADVVRRYYDAIGARDYAVAYAQWGNSGAASGKDYPAFAAGFADTAQVRVTVREVQPVEGAAGSLYATVPVTVDAVLADGRRQRFTGSYVIRRANDVDGASADDRRWHLASAKLTPG